MIYQTIKISRCTLTFNQVPHHLNENQNNRQYCVVNNDSWREYRYFMTTLLHISLSFNIDSMFTINKSSIYLQADRRNHDWTIHIEYIFFAGKCLFFFLLPGSAIRQSLPQNCIYMYLHCKTRGRPIVMFRFLADTRIPHYIIPVLRARA